MRASTLADRCYDQLQLAIVTLELRPGTPLSEASLAERFGVSKSPVREALQRLARDGLVTLEPNRRCVVTGLDIAHIRDWYELRLILEPASLRRVAGQIDGATLDTLRRVNQRATQACEHLDLLAFVHNSDLFHLTLIDLNPNHALVGVVHDLFNKIRRVRVALYQEDSASGKKPFSRAGLAHHDAVIDRLAAGAFDDAVAMLQHDIQSFLNKFERGDVADALSRVAYR